MQSAWKVGVFVVLFGVLLLGAYAMLQKSIFAKPVDVYYAEFPDAGGVATGSAVLMAGVKVGQVKTVELAGANLARMTLEMDKGVKIPKGSTMLIPASFISLGDMRLQIIPPLTSVAVLSPGDTMVGRLGSPLENILPDTGKTMAELNKTLVSIQGLLADKGLKKDLTDLMETVTDTSKKFGSVATRMDGLMAANSGKFSSLLTTTSDTLKNMQAVSVEIKKLVASGELQSKTTALLDNLNEAVSHGKTLVTDLQSLVNDPEMRSSLKDTLSNVKVMSDSGTKIAANAEVMSSNGVEISEQTKTLMKKANDLADQVQGMIEKFNKMVDRIGGQGKNLAQGVEMESTLAQETRPSHTRTDVNIFVPMGKDKVMFGLYDAFESNKINLQLKRQMGPNLGLRYGAYASKPGVGVDYKLGSKLNLRGDLYGLNDTRLDARLGYRFNHTVEGWAGINNVFERAGLSFGVTVRK